MAKRAALLLTTFALGTIVSAGAAACAQGLDPRFAPQHDSLDAIYDRINAQARQSATPAPATMQAVKDPAAYKNFFNRVQTDLDVEYKNTAAQQAARQRDAMMTQVYESKRVSDLANWERAQVSESYATIGRSGRSRSSHVPAGAFNDIEARRQASLGQAQNAMYSSVAANQNAATRRSMALEEDANNLRDQVLSNQANPQKFGLQSVGTNLYVRQYGAPDAKLPPVHNAAARIVPMGSADD